MFILNCSNNAAIFLFKAALKNEVFYTTFNGEQSGGFLGNDLH